MQNLLLISFVPCKIRVCGSYKGVHQGCIMEIEYKQTKDFTADELQELFLSVHWESGNYPEKLVRAMHNSTRVISAWDGHGCKLYQ